jgi:hypothetical protein
LDEPANGYTNDHEMNPKMQAFFVFLKKMERSNKAFTAEDIADATGYELIGTVKTNLGKPVWRNVLRKTGPGQYMALEVGGLTEEEFMLRVSVKNMLQSPASAHIHETLSERLFAKARENFILSLELYNRPSLLNRLEGFAMLHCTAWEQLLKGKLIEDKGDGFIFKKDGRTKGLIECCEAEFKQRSNRLWKNIDAIAELRNMSTHLIMPELGVAYSPLFQAGVINFMKTYKAWVGSDALPSHAVGLLTLTTGAKAPSAIDLSTKYGPDLGDQISAIINQVTFQIEADTHPEYAIVVKHQMRFASGAEADFTLEQLLALDGKVAFIEKARDATDDLLPGHVVEAVNKLLKDQLPLEIRRAIFTYKGNTRDTMNIHDFQVLCVDQGWKKSNNEFHQGHGPLNRDTFTIKCVHWIVDKLKDQNDYLAKRKVSYMAKVKSGRKKRK